MPEASDLIAEARERWRLAAEAENQWRPQCLIDMKFRIGQDRGRTTQWEEADVISREMLGTPSLTMNRTPQFCRQVENEARQNKPAIDVIPVDDSDVEDAEIRQGLIRHIENNSNADIARATARAHMVTMGFGYTRLTTEFCDDESFDQDLLIKRVLNPFAVHIDPSAEEADQSDAQWGIIHSQVTKEQHRRLWPNARMSSITGHESPGDLEDWIQGDNIRIADYFRIVYRKRKLVGIANYMGGPDTVIGFADEFGDTIHDHEIVREREVQIPRVMWHKINGFDELEKPKEWPGRWIPIIPWVGDEWLIDGRRTIAGMIRSARPAQQLYNFWVSALAEMVSLWKSSPWMATAEQIAKYETMYETANTRNYPVLLYKAAAGPNGELLPPPRRDFANPPVQGITACVIQADQDLKNCFGIHDAGLGQRGAQESGRAIAERKLEGDVSNYHLLDNETRALRFEGRQILNCIPRVYDKPRVARIVLPDNSTKPVALNQPTKWKGIERVFDLKVGRYDVVINVGPTVQTKRKEAVLQLTETMKVVPPEMAAAMAPTLIRNIDMPGSGELAKQAEKVLPPNLQTQDEDAQQPIPPQVQAEIQALQQQAEATKAFAEELLEENKQLKAGIEKEALKAESQQKIAEMKADNDRFIAVLEDRTKRMIEAAKLEIEEEKIEMQRSLGELSARLDSIKARDESAHRDADREHSSEEAEREREHGADQADRDRELAAKAAKEKSNGSNRKA